MTKLLNGAELVGYIQERQARQVRALRQADKVVPRLAIIKSTSSSPAIDVYVRMKQRYGAEILIDVVVETCHETNMPAAIERLNADTSVHGIIVQLPLADPSLTDQIVDMIAPAKDVDGLGKDARFTSATAEAVNWLLASYAIELRGKKLVIVGNGRLVGAPLAKMWRSSNLDVTVLDRSTEDIGDIVRTADVIVSATGSPRIIGPTMVAPGAVVVDAGTASEKGVLVGDVDPAVRLRDDVKITPEKGGVGPLTIVMLFDHVIQAAQATAQSQQL